MLYLAYSFLKKNQQFITQSVRADYGSYFITTYIQAKTIWSKKKKKKRR